MQGELHLNLGTQGPESYGELQIRLGTHEPEHMPERDARQDVRIVGGITGRKYFPHLPGEVSRF